MTSLKPSELLRKKLQKRAETSNTVKVSPSERRSKSFKKKLGSIVDSAKGSGVTEAVRYDCNRCTDDPCGFVNGVKRTLATCGKNTRTTRCSQCGQRYTFRWDENLVFDYCTPCRISIENEQKRTGENHGTD